MDYPNIITPNGDGKNEIFVIESENITSLRVQVRDMNGRLIHEWNNLHGFWDGRLGNGDQAPEGTYLINIFAVRADGQAVHKPATLELKR
jgi:gliding motility-associated-like protein